MKSGDIWSGWAPAFLIFFFGGAIATVVFAYTTFELKDHAKDEMTAVTTTQVNQDAKINAILERMIRVEDKIDYIGDLPPGWKKKGR